MSSLLLPAAAEVWALFSRLVRLSFCLSVLRQYVHEMCTPTRSAFQTGRLAAHVQMTLAGPCAVVRASVCACVYVCVWSR